MFNKQILDEIRRIAMYNFGGDIYPEIRAIMFTLVKGKGLHFRYYLDRPPIEKDIESLDIFLTNLEAGLWRNINFDIAKEDCIFSTEPMQKLGEFGIFLYARKEDVKGFKFY